MVAILLILSSTQQPFERLPELWTENGVDDGVEGGVEVAQPQEKRDDVLVEIAKLGRTQRHEQRHDEKRQPADDERTGDDGQSFGRLAFALGLGGRLVGLALGVAVRRGLRRDAAHAVHSDGVRRQTIGDRRLLWTGGGGRNGGEGRRLGHRGRRPAHDAGAHAGAHGGGRRHRFQTHVASADALARRLEDAPVEHQDHQQRHVERGERREDLVADVLRHHAHALARHALLPAGVLPAEQWRHRHQARHRPHDQDHAADAARVALVNVVDVGHGPEPASTMRE